MSTHAVRIIEIERVDPHPDPETTKLALVPIGGWQAVVQKEQFKPGDRAIYIEPDYNVPLNRPEFAFLRSRAPAGYDFYRLRATRLRGVLSFGLLINEPEETKHLPVGSDVMELMGIERYIAMQASDIAAMPFEDRPKMYSPHFDVESLANHVSVLQPGEEVIATEKVHGTNSRYVVDADGKFKFGSRTRWVKPEGTVWAGAAEDNSNIERWCRMHPETVLYGEVYGRIASLKYGLAHAARFVAFAAITGDKWWNLDDLFKSCALLGVPTVPVLYRGPYDPSVILPLAEDDSKMPTAPKGHKMEGLVIVPVTERMDLGLGRVAVKHISNRYWTGSDD